MTAYHYLKNLYAQYRISPETFRAYLRNMHSYIRGFEYAERWPPKGFGTGGNQQTSAETHGHAGNPLLEYFQNNSEGPGIWKWEHYFEVYQRHFSHLVGRAVNILEIGVYSGGSMNMWRSYFGSRSHIYGVDIEPACKAYEREGVTIMIGDQRDRGFWNTFRNEVDGIDVLIDDGGHKSEQQMVTLEEMLPHIRPGGVYLCEDIHGIHRELSSFASGIASELNRYNPDGAPSGFQKYIHSVHLYPYLLVIEKHLKGPARFHAPKHGTEWQPFFDPGITSRKLTK